MASLAPSKGEQAGLYIEMFTFAASAVILFLVGIVFNWKVAKDMGAAVARLAPPQLGGVRLRETATKWLSQWQDEFRRVRRTITFLMSVGLLGIVFADACIIAIAGTQERDDQRVSEWQRWAAYVWFMALTTAGMAQYYALELTPTWIFALIPAAWGMAMGVFASLTSVNTANGKGKVVVFSVFGPILLIALVPLFYVYTNYSILKRWWRGFPIVIHVALALFLWIILWAGPEVGGPDTNAARVGTTWGYFIVVLIWMLVYLLMVYFWKMGPPKRRTHATDAVVSNGGGDAENGTGGIKQPKRVVNLNPSSPHYALPKGRGRGGAPPLEAIRGRPLQPARAVRNGTYRT